MGGIEESISSEILQCSVDVYRLRASYSSKTERDKLKHLPLNIKSEMDFEWKPLLAPVEEHLIHTQ